MPSVKECKRCKLVGAWETEDACPVCGGREVEVVAPVPVKGKPSEPPAGPDEPLFAEEAPAKKRRKK